MTRLHGKRLRLLAAAAIVGACSAATKQVPDTIVFSHNVHAEQGIACGDCHQGLSEDAEREVDPLMRMAACGDCHDVESPEGCGTCHSNAQAPGTYVERPETHLLFSHQRHEERAADCARCHGDAANAPTIRQGVMHANVSWKMNQVNSGM
jgi:formate-dependent nitrite reductase cytochrome c552 subunit